VNAIDPHVDVVSVGEISLHEALALVLPVLGEAGDRSRRESGLTTEEPFQSRDKVSTGEPVQVEQGQHFGYLRRAAHIRRQDHALEPPALSILVHPLVVDPRSPNLHRSRSQEDLAGTGAPIANDQGVASLVALIVGRIEIGFYLRLQGLGQHLPRSGSGDLIEVEHELFTLCLVLMYSEHSAVYPSRRRWRVGCFDYLLGKVHRVPQEISDPQLLTISPFAIALALMLIA